MLLAVMQIGGKEITALWLSWSMSSYDSGAAEMLMGYSGDVRKYVGSLVKSQHLVDDVVQETYLRALAWVKRKPMPRNPRSWLLTTARNTAYTMLEKENGRLFSGGDLEGVIQDGDEPPDLVAREELIETVQENIGRLSPRYQRLVLGMYREGRSIRQLAKEEGLGHTNTKVTLYRARRKLETLLERDCSALVSDLQNP